MSVAEQTKSRSAATSAVKMSVDHATKYYDTRSGSVHALDNVSLDVREGEFLCILGPSGCGKSTLLWSMAGLHELSGGEIRLGDEPITKPHPEIAMIFQDANLLPWRNLDDNIALPFELKHKPPDRAAHRPAARAREPQGLREQVSARTVGRHAAARLDRAQPRGQSLGAADGRAVRRARCLHAR